MAYSNTIERPDEPLVFEGKIHWMVYLPSIVIAILAVLMFILAVIFAQQDFSNWALVLPLFGSPISFLVALVLWARALYIRLTTEIVVLPGQFRAPLQLHRGLDRLDALASCSNGLTERSPEPLIGFDQMRVLIRRGNRRL